MMTGAPWSAEDDAFLVAHPEMLASEIGRRLGRTANAVNVRKGKLGLRNRWPQHVAAIPTAKPQASSIGKRAVISERWHAGDCLEAIAALLNVNRATVSYHCRALGLRRRA